MNANGQMVGAGAGAGDFVDYNVPMGVLGENNQKSWIVSFVMYK